MNQFTANLSDGIAMQELNLIFVIDCSGSMYGENIGAVNNAIRDVMSIMPDIQNDTSDAKIMISALAFSDEAKWVNPMPMSADQFRWNDIDASGGTNLSEAYDRLAGFLCKKSKGGMMPDIGGLAPIIIMMSDGAPTSPDWDDHLNALKKKGWFKYALKYALSIGAETTEAVDVLDAFTGTDETVLKVYNAEALRQVIKVIAVTASKVKSNSTSVSLSETGTDRQFSFNEQAQSQIADALSSIKDVEW